MKLKIAEMSHFWKYWITMPYYYVGKMKTVASWKKNGPILETKMIEMGKIEGKSFFSPGPLSPKSNIQK